MLFDPSPKESRKDFFDREKEIEQLESLKSRVVLILGLRRTGKSSLVKIVLNDLNLPYVYIDLRRFEEMPNMTYRDLIRETEREVNRLKYRYPGIVNFLRGLKGVGVMGNEVRFSWGKDRLSFSDLLVSLNDWAEDKVLVVIDEAQELGKLRGVDLLPSFAYSYDNLKKVKIVLTGSEMGLLHRYLKTKDPDSPLFGRAMSEVQLKPFRRNEAIDFLKRGFEEQRVQFREYEMVYEEIGGIPGWLTYFGFTYTESRDLERSLKKTLDHAKKLVLKEFENFLVDKQTASKRYYTVMRVMAGCGTWSEVQRSLEAQEGVRISDSTLYNYLTHLADSSWIVKEKGLYCPTDPLIKIAFKERAQLT